MVAIYFCQEKKSHTSTAKLILNFLQSPFETTPLGLMIFLQLCHGTRSFIVATVAAAMLQWKIEWWVCGSMT